MDQQVNVRSQKTPPPQPSTTPPSPVLSRLLDEVRNERKVEARYDRVHNRHNRGR